MQIALDATYSIDKYPSGIAIYSREILNGLASSHPSDQFTHYFRLKQYRKAACEAAADQGSAPPRRRLWPLIGGAFSKHDIFHALNQRVDRRLARRVVTTFHDLFVMTGEYSSSEFRRRFAQQAKTAARNSDVIVAVSQFTADQVHELLGIERSRIRVVPHGVHMPAHAPGTFEKMVLTVGAIQLRKNTARLIEAFEAMPDDWTLVLAGSPAGYGAEAILSGLERSRAKQRILVAGYVSTEKLERLYRRAAIFAFPSLDEGFGIPVLEAMAHGVPVITSNTSALPEAAGDAALLVDPHNSEAISAALLQLAADPVQRDDLAKAGRLRAQAFPWSRAVDETYDVYCHL